MNSKTNSRVSSISGATGGSISGMSVGPVSGILNPINGFANQMITATKQDQRLTHEQVNILL